MRIYQGGIRKLLSTGMQVSASYGLTRSWTNLATGTFNPSYFNQFIVDFNQPLLRGFGLDHNRSRIENARLERDKSIEVLRRNIRETLFNVEQSLSPSNRRGQRGHRRPAAEQTRADPHLVSTA